MKKQKNDYYDYEYWEKIIKEYQTKGPTWRIYNIPAKSGNIKI